MMLPVQIALLVVTSNFADADTSVTADSESAFKARVTSLFKHQTGKETN